MKKLIALCGFGLALSTSFAQVPAVPAADAAPVAAAVETAVAAVAAPAGEITIKGEVSVVNGPDGALQMIFINPADGTHGYKVDIVNGEGKTLADKDGKIVKATGVDVNRLFNVASVAVVE